MKKLLSVFLAALMLFTVFAAVPVFAADGDDDSDVAKYYTIIFNDEDGTLIATRVVEEFGTVKAPADPSKADTTNEDGKTVTYTFAGWVAEGDDNGLAYKASTIPYATRNVTYVATYTETVQGDRITVMSLIRDIFARLNTIFEYFFRIFNRGSND